VSRADPLLDVRGLSVRYRPVRAGSAFAVDDVSLAVERGETLALVGPSGCGKSTFARAIVRLVEAQSGHVLVSAAPGSAPVDLLQLRGSALRHARRAIGIVFQDPFASLNPRMRVGAALDEVLRVDGGARTSSELLDSVGLGGAILDRFPHELSGGQRQRVALARALAPGPRLLICDEILSALDVSIQAQILELLLRLRRESQLALLFIAHDMAVVQLIADRVAVMMGGRLLKLGTRDEIFGSQTPAGS
jgi:peptide/nickel transport system ATP-binding protein